MDPDEDFVVPGNGLLDLFDSKHVRRAEHVIYHCSHSHLQRSLSWPVVTRLATSTLVLAVRSYRAVAPERICRGTALVSAAAEA
ncbi:hypothetical protein GCM10028784_14710 [Myceligenerans cantabricum]